MDVGFCSHGSQHPDAHPDRAGSICTTAFGRLVRRRPSRGYGWMESGSCVDCWHADCRKFAFPSGLVGCVAGNHLRNLDVFCSSLFELKKKANLSLAFR